MPTKTQHHTSAQGFGGRSVPGKCKRHKGGVLCKTHIVGVGSRTRGSRHSHDKSGLDPSW